MSSTLEHEYSATPETVDNGTGADNESSGRTPDMSHRVDKVCSNASNGSGSGSVARC